MSFHLHKHTKIDGRSLWLYSQNERSYQITNDLPPVEAPSRPIMRHHPLRNEPVYFNPGRNTRTLNPPAEYNPLAPVGLDGYPGEIPVTDFEVAVFENRWPGLVDIPFETSDNPAFGRCEVIVYTTNSTGSLADLSPSRVDLLLCAVGDRTRQIRLDDRFHAIIPFENRGAFVGTSLPHPHGQLYAMGEMPPILERQVSAARETNFFESYFAGLDEKYVISETDHTHVTCPPFSRYPFETWIMPKRKVLDPLEMTVDERVDFARELRSQVARFDTILGEPMPYVMWHSVAPKGAEDIWPYHIQFWPLQRGIGKMKYLAGVEQIAQTFLVDVMPEDAAEKFKNCEC